MNEIGKASSIMEHTFLISEVQHYGQRNHQESQGHVGLKGRESGGPFICTFPDKGFALILTFYVLF